MTNQKFSIILALMATTALAEPGFKKPGDDGVPVAVTEASKASFRILVADPEPWVLPAEKIGPWVEKNCENTKFIYTFVCPLLRKCMDDNAETCKIDYTGSGTAFLAGDGQTLWTVRHNFDEQIDWITKDLPTDLSPTDRYNTILKYEPSIVLMDANQKVVFDTRKSGDVATFSFIGDMTLMGAFAEISPKKSTDIAKLALSRPLDGIRPLDFSATSPDLGEEVYIVGYPTSSKLRQTEFGVADSNGFDQYVSTGEIVSLASYYSKKSGQTVAEDDPQIKLLNERLIAYDADGVPGQSGSPVINSKGEVVSIFSTHASYNENPEDQYHPAGGFGVRIDWMWKLINQFTISAEE